MQTALAAALLAGRILFGGFFVVSSFNHFSNTAMLAEYAASRGVPMPTVAILLSGLMILVGGALVVAGFAPRVGLLLIALFLVGVTPAMHQFWTFTDPMMRANEMGNFMKNVGLLGGALALLAIPTPWTWSADERRAAGSPRRRARMA